MHTSQAIDYLKAAGFAYCPPDSPLLWDHLESRFREPTIVGPRFAALTPETMAALITEGETLLLNELVESHRRTGELQPVLRTLTLPYDVGTHAVAALDEIDPSRILTLIGDPGTARERLIRVVPVPEEAIPRTQHVTIHGGLYPDGRTAGFLDLHPGTPASATTAVYLATPKAIRHMAALMHHRLELITSVSEAECREMLERVAKAVPNL